jgi:chromosome segregation ATPase
MNRLQRSLRWGTFAINTASPTMRGRQQPLQHQQEQEEEQRVNNSIETKSDNIESHLSVDETMSSTDSHNDANEEKASLLSEEESIRRQLRIKEEEVDNLHYKLSILEQSTNDDAQLINTLQMENSKLKERYYYQIAKMTASHANNLKGLEMRYDSHLGKVNTMMSEGI